MTSRQIADDLAARIESGEYPAGSQLPSIRELAELYSVSASTIQRALIHTHARGLTVGQSGRGIFVSEG
jgi:GntR family transcriptional regulator